MENSGWIYFRVVEGRGYCFGKTDNPSRRDSEYRKENPWVEKIYDFFVEDMHAVEAELVERTKGVRLLENSKEWIRLCDEAREIVDSVREQYALMTHAEWDRIRTEKKAAQENSEREQAEQWQRQQEAAAERQRAEVHRLRQEAEMRARVALLTKPCPSCAKPMSYDAATTGYRCRRCGIQTM
jgi:hypothetical protein